MTPIDVQAAEGQRLHEPDREALRRPFWEVTPPTWRPTDAEYYGTPYLVGSSALKTFRRSRKLFKAIHVDRTTPEPPPSKEMVLGSAVDCLLTEPEAYAERFTVRDDAGPDTAGWGWPSRQAISLADAERADRISQAVLADEDAAGLFLGEGLSQMRHRWIDDLGVFCRTAWDRAVEVKGEPCCVELKTWTLRENDSSRSRKLTDYQTAEQMAFQERGGLDLLGVRPGHVMVVVNSIWPHDVHVFRLSDRRMAKARDRVGADLRALGECIVTNNWAAPSRGELEEI